MSENLEVINHVPRRDNHPWSGRLANPLPATLSYAPERVSPGCLWRRPLSTKKRLHSTAAVRVLTVNLGSSTRRMEIIMLALPTPEATLAASERLILFCDHGAAHLAARQCALLAQNSLC